MNMKTPDNTEKPKPRKSRLGKLTLQKDIFDTALKDDLKSRVDIVSLFSHFGVQLTKKGKSYTGLCPWHDDTNPSLSVDKEKGLYNCFGCGESGDVFTLVEKMKGVSFQEALDYLKKYISLPVSESQKQAAPRKAVKKAPSDIKTALSLNDVSNFYQKKLTAHKMALEYLKSRGITNETITYFNIGYSDGTLKETVGVEGLEQLQANDLFTEKGYELFSNCVIVPLTDSDNQVLSFYGRRVSPPGSGGDKEGVQKFPQHLYPAGEHKAVFHEKAYKVYDQIILTESVIDALSLFSVGIQNVSCIYGTQGLTKLHIAKLHEHAIREVILALDKDSAGKEATEKYTQVLLNEGFAVKTIKPSGAKDWNESLVDGFLEKEEVLSSIDTAEVVKPEPTGRNFRKTDSGLVLTHDDMTYTVKQDSSSRLNVKCEMDGEVFYDRVDLVSSRSRSSFAGNVSRIFDTETKRIEKDLIALLEYLEEEKEAGVHEEAEEIVLTEEDKALGMSFLTNPDMFEEIVKDTETLGYVGEETNKKLMYLAATSRLLDDPVSILILSESGSGKSYLVNTIKKLMPPEDIIDATSLSDQALNYMGDILHKFLVLSEAVHKDVVEHQLREIASEKKLTRFVVKKDEKTGVMKTVQVTANAIVSMVMSSTNYKVNPENASRAFIINADETGEQTYRIYKNQSLDNTFARHRQKKEDVPRIIRKHISAQRMLQNYVVISHFDVSEYFPKSKMRYRRDHKRFHVLIVTVCFLRQYQKEVKERDGYLYIECDFQDYEIARALLLDGIFASELDDFSTGTKRLLRSIQEMVQTKAQEQSLRPNEVRFIQKELRESSGFGHEFVKKHMRKLVEYEYLEVLSGRTSGTRYSYRLRDSRDMKDLRESIIPTAEELRKNTKQ
jgi:DNA primase catalytic core